VVRVESAGVVLSGSPFRASIEGMAGDRGTIEGRQVVDVTEEADGHLHVLADGASLPRGTRTVWAEVDGARRAGIARAHTIALVAVEALKGLGIGVRSMAVADARAWLDVNDWRPHQARIEMRLRHAIGLPAPIPKGFPFADGPLLRTRREIGDFSVAVGRARVVLSFPDRPWSP